MPRAVALYSGGLDSTLAIRIMQAQGLEVEALNIRTTFDCCRLPAAQLAAELGVRLTILSVEDDYVEVIRHPTFGYGKGFNPCVDCRIYMCTLARRFMHEVGACVVVTGEILGQRPMSQKRRDLETIARHSGLEGRLLRPLSAKRLPPTIAEQEGLIDREALYEFEGRRRSELIALARRLEITKIPTPSTGCSLTEKSFAPRVRDLLQLDPSATRADFDLLNYGRHVRHDDRTKIVIGRNAQDNAALRALYQQARPSRWTFLHPEDFLGPDAVVVGHVDEEVLRFCGALLFRYARLEDRREARVAVTHGTETHSLRIEPMPEAQSVSAL